MSHFNVSDLKIENLTNFIMLFPFLISISYYYHVFMIDKVTWHSYAKGLIPTVKAWEKVIEEVVMQLLPLNCIAFRTKHIKLLNLLP